MRRLLIPIIFLAMILAACQANTPVTTEIPNETESIQSTEAPTDTPVKTEAVQNTEVAEETSIPNEEDALSDSPPPGCTVISARPTPGPTEQSLYPPVSEEDWVSGPDDASITIIEYSDFQ